MHDFEQNQMRYNGCFAVFTHGLSTTFSISFDNFNGLSYIYLLLFVTAAGNVICIATVLACYSIKRDAEVHSKVMQKGLPYQVAKRNLILIWKLSPVAQTYITVMFGSETLSWNHSDDNWTVFASVMLEVSSSLKHFLAYNQLAYC